MTGDYDYLVRLVVADLADFERIHNQFLTRLPSVARVHSSFAVRTIATTTSLPLKNSQRAPSIAGRLGAASSPLSHAAPPASRDLARGTAAKNCVHAPGLASMHPALMTSLSQVLSTHESPPSTPAKTCEEFSRLRLRGQEPQTFRQNRRARRVGGVRVLGGWEGRHPMHGCHLMPDPTNGA